MINKLKIFGKEIKLFDFNKDGKGVKKEPEGPNKTKAISSIGFPTKQKGRPTIRFVRVRSDGSFGKISSDFVFFQFTVKGKTGDAQHFGSPADITFTFFHRFLYRFLFQFHQV